MNIYDCDQAIYSMFLQNDFVATCVKSMGINKRNTLNTCLISLDTLTFISETIQDANGRKIYC